MPVSCEVGLSSTVSNKAPALQGHRATATEQSARSRHPRWQDSDLVITSTLEGRTVQRRPLHVASLRLIDHEAAMENVPRLPSLSCKYMPLTTLGDPGPVYARRWNKC